MSFASQVDEFDTGSDHLKKSNRNPSDGITDGSDSQIKITTHLINIHLIRTIGFNFTRLSDSIRSDCRIRSDSNTTDPDMIPFPESYEFYRISTALQSVLYQIR
jgi:hypothetical protein